MNYIAANYVAFFSTALSATATILALTGGTFTLLLQQMSQLAPTSVKSFPTKGTMTYLACLVLVLLVDGIVLILLPEQGGGQGILSPAVLNAVLALNGLVPVSVIGYVRWVIPWLSIDRTIEHLVMMAVAAGNGGYSLTKSLQALEELATTLGEKGYRTALTGLFDEYVKVISACRTSEAHQSVADSLGSLALIVAEGKLHRVMSEKSGTFWTLALCYPTAKERKEPEEPEELWLIIRPVLFYYLDNKRESEFGHFMSNLINVADVKKAKHPKTKRALERVAIVTLRILHAAAEKRNAFFMAHALEVFTKLRGVDPEVAKPYVKKATQLMDQYRERSFGRGGLFDQVVLYRRVGGSKTLGQLVTELDLGKPKFHQRP